MWVKCRTLPRRAWDVGQSPAGRRRISERGLVGLDLYTRVLIYSLFFNYYEFNLVKFCSLSWFYSDCWKKRKKRKETGLRSLANVNRCFGVDQMKYRLNLRQVYTYMYCFKNLPVFTYRDCDKNFAPDLILNRLFVYWKKSRF